MFNKKFFIENFKTLFYAFIIAIIIRSLIIQPFYIPSSSMEPGLLVGDRLFVTKYSYGYSKHSFPFSPPIFENRIFSSKPNRGDVIVFKTPADNRTDYIKRLIGLPGDRIQFVDSNLYLNNSEILKSKVCKKVKNNQPLYPGKRFPSDIGKVYCHSLLNNHTGKYKDIYHIWYMNDNLKAKVRIRVREGGEIPAVSQRQVAKSDKGTWRIEITDSDKKILDTVIFEVV